MIEKFKSLITIVGTICAPPGPAFPDVYIGFVILHYLG